MSVSDQHGWKSPCLGWISSSADWSGEFFSTLARGGSSGLSLFSNRVVISLKITLAGSQKSSIRCWCRNCVSECCSGKYFQSERGKEGGREGGRELGMIQSVEFFFATISFLCSVCLSILLSFLTSGSFLTHWYFHLIVSEVCFCAVVGCGFNGEEIDSRLWNERIVFEHNSLLFFFLFLFFSCL